MKITIVICPMFGVGIWFEEGMPQIALPFLVIKSVAEKS
jgi:hypothetical protein